MKTSRAKLFVAALLSTSLIMPALAKFDDKNHSITNTGETLQQGNFELNYMALNYGISDNLMLQVPVILSIMTQSANLGLRYKLEIGDNFWLSPEAAIIYIPSLGYLGAGGSLTAGLNITSDKKNTLSLGTFLGAYSAFNLIQISVENKKRITIKREKDLMMLPVAEYNHYTDSGNLFYLGAMAAFPELDSPSKSDAVVYSGFTWGFDNVHLGVSLNSLVYFVPTPYIYVRF